MSKALVSLQRASKWIIQYMGMCLFVIVFFLNDLNASNLFFVQQVNESEYWELVLKENSLDGYQRYMLEYPDGAHYDEAVEKVVVLRDEKAWQNALSENSPAAFSRYLKIYPRGIHVEDARKKLNLSNPPKNTRGSLAENPSPPTKKPSTKPTNPPPPVENKPAVDPEESLWSNAVQSGNSDLYKQYLNTYPSGKHKQKALENIPMEFSLTRSDSVDSMFFLTVKFAKKPVNIIEAEMPLEGLRYIPENPGSDGRSTRPKRRGRKGEETRYFFWPEGELTAFISDEDELSTEMVITVGSKNKYQLKLRDASDDSWEIELESSLPNLELLGVVGVDGNMDTAFFTIKGGVPEYFVRMVKKGGDVNDYLYEAPLQKDRAANTWFLDKNQLVNTGMIPSGNYEVYVLDSRKLEHIKHIRPLTIGSGLLVSNMSIYTYLLIPVVLLIIWMFLNWSKKSKDPYRSRRDKFRF